MAAITGLGLVRTAGRKNRVRPRVAGVRGQTKRRVLLTEGWSCRGVGGVSFPAPCICRPGLASSPTLPSLSGLRAGVWPPQVPLQLPPAPNGAREIREAPGVPGVWGAPRPRLAFNHEQGGKGNLEAPTNIKRSRTFRWVPLTAYK